MEVIVPDYVDDGVFWDNDARPYLLALQCCGLECDSTDSDRYGTRYAECLLKFYEWALTHIQEPNDHEWLSNRIKELKNAGLCSHMDGTGIRLRRAGLSQDQINGMICLIFSS